MDDKPFTWTEPITKRLLQVRHEYDWLFKKKKQPWSEFYKILCEKDFPKEMTVSHVRKKWSYMYEMYKIAKKTRNKSWKYYKEFEKTFGKTTVLDKYDSWNDESRLKLISCIAAAMDACNYKKADFNYLNEMWNIVEKAMRSSDLPLDCCMLDMKGLWHHIRMTFNRKHRLKLRRGSTDWPLYNAMLEYFDKYEPDYISKVESCDVDCMSRMRKASKNYCVKKQDHLDENSEEFQWSKDITESFIQIRLQHDWIFRERKWAWNDLLAIMQTEHGFPKILTGRELSRKWSGTYSEFQKAKATGNQSWIYYNLFEVYMGESSLSFNPIKDWQEEWVSNLISARVALDHLFAFSDDAVKPWREVEKRLRTIGLPIDHSVLELSEIWTHLLKTYKWKRKFADKGMLNEQWAYYEAMAQYEAQSMKRPKRIKHNDVTDVTDVGDDVTNDDDYEDDMKLFDLKQKMETKVKPKTENPEVSICRACGGAVDASGVGLDGRDERGDLLADKLSVIAGVLVEPSDNLPQQICLNCLRVLETAYSFRRRCQDVDRNHRAAAHTYIVKLETAHADPTDTKLEHHNDHDTDDHFLDNDNDQHEREPKKQQRIYRRTKKRKSKYVYWKVCEICGKSTINLKSHLDAHAPIKRYSCNVCGKEFRYKSGLFVHKTSHDPSPKKTCEICGKTFHVMAQYRRHFVHHANERKYECETCGKRFNTMDILRVHNRIHTDERPYSCSECGKTFRTRGCVSRHKRIVHSIKTKVL